MAVGRDLKGKKNMLVAVIGDGAMTAGQAYEAMNNAGYLDSDMIVILNDNKQVSLPTANLEGPIPPVGALSSALSRLQSNRPLRELREVAKVYTHGREGLGWGGGYALINLLGLTTGFVTTETIAGSYKTNWWTNA